MRVTITTAYFLILVLLLAGCTNAVNIYHNDEYALLDDKSSQIRQTEFANGAYRVLTQNQEEFVLRNITIKQDHLTGKDRDGRPIHLQLSSIREINQHQFSAVKTLLLSTAIIVGVTAYAYHRADFSGD